MSNILNKDGVHYHPAPVAAKQLGYTKEYLLMLAKQGKIDGCKEKNRWYIDISSAQRFFATATDERADRRREVSLARKRELRLHAASRAREKQRNERISRRSVALVETLAVVVIGLTLGVSGYTGIETGQRASVASATEFIDSFALWFYRSIVPDRTTPPAPEESSAPVFVEQTTPAPVPEAETPIPPALVISQPLTPQPTIIRETRYARDGELDSLISIVSGLTRIVGATLDPKSGVAIERVFVTKQADALYESLSNAIDSVNDSIDDTNGDLSTLTADVTDLAAELAVLSDLVATSSFAQGGNSFGTDAVLGTTDNQPFALITNGVERMRILENGNIGIGTTTPGQLLTVARSTAADTNVKVINAVNQLDFGVDSTGTFLQSRVATSNTAAPMSFWVGSTQALTMSTAGNVGIGTTTPDQRLSVEGSGYFTGGLGIGVATTTAGVLQTAGDAHIGGNLTVIGDSTVFGASAADSLVINSSIKSDLVPDQNVTYDLGSPSFYWDRAYIGTLNVNNIAAANTTISGTQNESFVINSDNASADTEDAVLTFFRGAVVPNALITWNSTLDRFELNQPTYIENAAGSIASTTLTLRGVAGQTADILSLASSTGDTLFTVGPDGSMAASGTISGSTFTGTGTGTSSFAGSLGIGTTTPERALAVVGNQDIHAANTHLRLFDTDVIGYSYIERNGARTNFGNNNGTSSAINMVINDAGNVGIGTTAPGERLDVIGNILSRTSASTGALYFGNSSHGIQRRADGSTRDIEVFTDGANSSFFVSTNGAGSKELTILDSGYVGLGTQSPETKLHLVTSGGNYVQNRITFEDTAALRNNWIGMGSDADELVIAADHDNLGSDSNIQFRVDATERMRITSGGNVGIGTTTPTAKLQVNGTIVAEEAGNGRRISIDAANGNIELSSGSGPFYIGRFSAQPMILNAGGGSVSIGTTSTGARLAVSQDNTQHGLANGYGQISIRGLTNDNQRLNIGYNTSGDYGWLQAGINGSGYGPLALNPAGANVGIGTSSPVSSLEVASSGSTGVTITGGAASSPLLSLRQGATTKGYLRFVENGANIDTLELQSDGHIYLNPVHNVGIGTTTPTKKLDVVGTSETSIRVSDTGGANLELYQQATDSYVLATNALRFYTGGAPRMQITAAGNVGVGSTTPLNRLSVFSSSAGTIPFGAVAADGSYLAYISELAGGQGQLDIANASGSSVVRLSGGSTSSYIASGNFGIGTTTPDATLQVVNASNSVYNLSLRNGGGLAKGLLISGGNTLSDSMLLRIEDLVGSPFFTVTDGNSYFENGNVGIGTTTPTARIDVVSVFDALPARFLRHGTYGEVIRLGRNLVSESASITYPSDGNLAFDTAGFERLRINASGHVGIGTTSPSRRFDVWDGSSSIVANFRSASGNDSFVSFSNNSSTADQVRVGSTAGNLVLSTNYTERMRIDSSGNVGIGTAAPSAPLTVYRSPSATLGAVSVGLFHHPSGSSGQPLWGMRLDNADFDLMFDRLVGGVWQTPALAIKRASGNVGIGTTNPGARLHINDGGASITDTLPPSVRAIVQGTGNNQLSILSADGGLSLVSFGDVDNYNAGAVLYDNNAHALSFRTNDVPDRMVIDSSGNVGIGTTSPQAKLEIYNSIISTLFSGDSIVMRNHFLGGGWARPLLGFEDESGNDYWQLGGYGTGQSSTYGYLGQAYNDAVLKWNASNQLGVGIGSNASPALQLAIGDADTGLAQTSEDTLNIYTGNVRRMTFDSNGNVGVGTTSPYAKLSVTGGTTGSDTLFALGTRLRVTGDGVTRWGADATQGILSWDAGRAIIGAQAGNDLSLISGGSERIRITASGGFVGIGTTTPLAKLHVTTGSIGLGAVSSNADELVLEGVGPSGISILSGATSDGSIFFGDSGSATIGRIVYSHTDNDLSFWTGATERMTVLNSGNVGIGVTTPNAVLDISGAGVSGRGLRITETSASKSSNAYTLTVDSTAHNTNVSAAGAMAVDVNSGRAFTINGLGNIGIGTSSPSSRLYVVGTNNATGGLTISSNTGTETDRLAIFAEGNSSTVIQTLASGGVLAFRNHTGAETMRISGGGTLGIGTQSPAGDIHVFRTGSNANILAERSGGARVALEAQATVGWIGTVTNHNLSIGTNSAARMVVTTAGRVGMGATSPTYKLDIKDGEAIIGLQDLDTGGEQWTMQAGVSGFYISHSGVLTNGLTINQDSSVGIGMTSPAAKLDVLGSIRTSVGSGGTLTLFESDATRQNRLVAGADADGAYITSTYNTGGTGDLLFKNVNTTNMIIKSNGNIGIGTTTPGVYKLVVDGLTGSTNGQVLFTGTNPNIRLWDTDAGVNSGTYQMFVLDDTLKFRSVNDSGSVRADNILVVAPTGNVGIGTSSPSEKLQVNGRIKIGADSTIGNAILAPYGNGGLIIRPEFNINDSSSAVLEIQDNASTPLVSFKESGHVGIGTTSPAYRLDVQNSTGAALARFADSDSSYAGLVVSADTGGSFIGNNDIGVSVGEAIYFQNSLNATRFFTNSTEKMRITSTGSVGIGTTAPSANAKLHIEGSNALVYTEPSADDGQWNGFNTLNSSGAVIGGIAANTLTGEVAVGSRNASYFTALYGGSSEKMRITSSGNVGIGTTNPLATLHVNGGTGGVINASTTAQAIITGTAPTDAFSTPRLAIAPTSFLNTQGLSAGELYFTRRALGGSYADYGSGIRHYTDAVSDARQNGLQLFTSNVSEQNVARLTITNTGNVGIGTSTPDAKLHVALPSGDANALALTRGNGSDALLLRLASYTSGDTGRGLEFYNTTDASSLMFLTQGGNVGIGTTNPSNKLTVSAGINGGGITIGGAQAPTLSFVTSNSDSAARNWAITNNYGTLGDFRIIESATSTSDPYPGATRFTILSGGNVGIGTTTPVSKLAVYGPLGAPATSGTSDGGIFRVSSPSTAVAIDMGVMNSPAAYAWMQTHAWTDHSLEYPLSINPNGGSVGIGTTTPASLLEVAGSAPTLTLSSTKNGTWAVDELVAGLNFYSTDASSIGAGVKGGIRLLSNDTTGARTDLVLSASSAGVNNKELMRLVGDTGNVGVGTTTPSARLDVYADTTNSPVLSVTGSPASAGIYVAQITSRSGGARDLLKIESPSATLNNAVNALSISDASKSLFVVRGDGNVGIGTTTALAKLHIIGPAVAQGQYSILGLLSGAGSDASQATLELKALRGNTTANQAFALQSWQTSGVGSAPRALLLNAEGGNVGIGTTSPSARFHVYGSAQAVGQIESTDTAAYLMLADASSTSAIGQGIGSNGNDLVFRTNGGTRAVLTYTGNFGIGTTTPQKALVVSSAVTGPEIIVDGGNNARGSSIQFNQNGLAIGYLGVSAELETDTSSDFALWGATGAGLRFYTDNSATERMVIDTSGNVGIGTTTPSAQLTVAGSQGGILVDRTGNDPYIQLSSSGVSAGQLRYFAPGVLSIADANGTDRVVFDTSTGNVGIGTTTPSAKLDVWGNLNVATGTTPALFVDTATGRVGIGTATPNDATLTVGDYNNGAIAGKIRINSATNNVLTIDGDGYNQASNPMRFSVNSVTLLTLSGSNSIFNNGNVGIGTQAPNAKFHINDGGVTITDTVPSSARAIVQGSGNNQLVVLSTDGGQSLVSFGDIDNYNAGAVLYDNSTHALSFRTNDVADRMVISSNGNVGIGTTTPQRILHVMNVADGAPVRFEDANGYCEIDPTSTTWTCTSDKRLKENIESLDGADVLSNLAKLRPVSFAWKSDATHAERIGLIAQEVEALFPDLVSSDSTTGYKSVAYGGFTTYLLSGMRELAEERVQIAALLASGSGSFESSSPFAEILNTDSVWSRLVALAQNFIDGVLQVSGLRTDELCVGAVCIDEATFLRMVEDSGGAPAPIVDDTDADEDDTGSGSTPTPPPDVTDPADEPPVDPGTDPVDPTVPDETPEPTTPDETPLPPEEPEEPEPPAEPQEPAAPEPPAEEPAEPEEPETVEEPEEPEAPEPAEESAAPDAGTESAPASETGGDAV